MAKLGQYTNPISGQKGKVTDIGGFLSLMMGGAILIAAMGGATWLVNKIKGLAPAGIGNVIGTGSIFTPAPSSGPTVQTTSAGPRTTHWG